MSLSVGIIGLEQSGRTTIFNTLTGLGVQAGRSRQQEHIGVARVPDCRVSQLAKMFKSKKSVYGEVTYIDLGASVKSMAKDFNLSGRLLSQLGTTDALLCVVRGFKDDSIPHPQLTVDPVSDIEAMELELAFSDLAIIERRLERIAGQVKGSRSGDRSLLDKEALLLKSLQNKLESGVPLRRQELDDNQLKQLSSYQFLSLKPLLTIINIGEEELLTAGALEADLKQRFGDNNHRIIALAGKLEAELATLDENSQSAFLSEFNLDEPGLNRVIRTSFEFLGLVSFLTTGEDESRAWPVAIGTAAPKAAGVIHSDIERGFIRAEVANYDDMVRLGGYAGLRREGLLRVEGKNYIVQDGDVINFLFNV